ncbi:MAG: type II toxin-antitoxin system death-on-curing family toxin [Patescibacteria group bacterium]
MCHRLAATFFNKIKEPIPDFSNVDKPLLKSAINLPRATYAKHELYPTLFEKGAILFYTLIKNHPFPNGNKRIATASLLVFLYLNDYWMETPKGVLYKKAIKIAESKASERDVILKELQDWIREEISKESDEGRLRRLLIGFWRAILEKMTFKRRKLDIVKVPVVKMSSKRNLFFGRKKKENITVQKKGK